MCKNCVDRARSVAKDELECIPMRIFMCRNGVDPIRSPTKQDLEHICAMRFQNCVDRAWSIAKHDLEHICDARFRCKNCVVRDNFFAKHYVEQIFQIVLALAPVCNAMN